MRFLLPFLFTLTCAAQLPTIPFVSQPQSGVVPIGPGLAHWWVFSDVATNVVVSNQWSDRIVGLLMEQGDPTLRPTNSSLGVRFQGAQQLTNTAFEWAPAPVSSVNTGTVFVVFTFENAAQFPTLFGNHVGGSTIGGITSLARYQYNLADKSSALPASKLLDVIMVLTNLTAASKGIVYTNGVVSVTGATIPHQLFDLMGNDKVGDVLKGYILQYGNSTNIWSPTDVSAAHTTWSTIYSGYFP